MFLAQERKLIVHDFVSSYDEKRFRKISCLTCFYVSFLLFF